MKENLYISEYTSDDKEGVLKCLQQVWSISEIDEKTLAKFFQNENYLYVAKLHNRVIGCATLHLQYKLIRNGGVAGFLEEVVIDDEFRGKGVGEELVKFVLEKSKEKGCYKTVLCCYPERVNFYLRCGLTEETITMRWNP